MKTKILILLSILLLVTGCGNTNIKDDGKVISYEKTGQILRNDILCRPAEDDLLELYKKHDPELIEDIPECKDFNITSGGYTGLWESLFVKPLATLLLFVGDLFKNMGISVIVVGILIRLLMFPLSKKTAMQSINLKKAQPELQKIEKKYKDKTDRDDMLAKSQEMMLVYKKFNISPISGCFGSLIQLPIFFAFLDAINRVPAIFEGSLLGFNLGMTPWVGMANGNYSYIILIGLIILSTYLSFKNTMSNQSSDEMQQQMKFMMNIMLVTISIASLNLPVAIGLYWIATNIYAVAQNKLVMIHAMSEEEKAEHARLKKEKTANRKSKSLEVKEAKITNVKTKKVKADKVEDKK